MKTLPSFFENRILIEDKIKPGRPFKDIDKLIKGATISNFTVTDEPILRIISSINENKEKRNNRSNYYVNVDCSCGNNLWVKTTYLLRGEHKSCVKCRAEVREGSFKSLFHMKVWNNRYNEIKRRAKDSNIPFDLTPIYLKELMDSQNNKCGITGEDIVEVSGNISLDKKDPSLGYTKGNVQWTNRKSNTMKQDLTMQQLLDWCKKVIEYNK
jgi:hypothetical protein